MTGRVIEAISGRCAVYADGGVFDCAVKGVFRKNSLFPKAGDVVDFDVIAEKEGNVTAIRERKNTFIRPAVSNVDIMLIVSSLSSPPPDPENIDKMTAICEHYGVEPVIIFTKSDIATDASVSDVYKNAGYKVFVVSNADAEGVNKIKNLISGKLAVLTGFSGVGKSTLLNRLCDGAESAVGPLSEKLGRGMNTTRRATLFRSEDGFIADTPGFSSLDITMCIDASKEDIKDLFPEFSEFGQCRFVDCLHLEGTKGCEVCRAFKDGKIAPSRYKSYLKFYEAFASLKRY